MRKILHPYRVFQYRQVAAEHESFSVLFRRIESVLEYLDGFSGIEKAGLEAEPPLGL